MYILGLLIIVATVIYIILGRNKTTSSRQNQSYNDTQTGRESFSPPIPSGYQKYVYAGNLTVAGIQYRKAEALRFANSSNQELILEREPNNEHDPNAIKLVGVSGSKKYFIGYIPKEISEQIVSTKLFDCVKPRLESIYIGKNDYLEIQYGIIGPKANKKQFDAFLENQPASTTQKEYYKFFSLTVPKGLTTLQAKQTILEHKKTCKPEELAEWEGFINIQEEFGDSDFRGEYDLKKVSKAVLNEALNQLKQEGKTYSYLSENIDDVVNQVIKLKPELEKFL
jgi:hypothetical protein